MKNFKNIQKTWEITANTFLKQILKIRDIKIMKNIPLHLEIKL